MLKHFLLGIFIFGFALALGLFSARHLLFADPAVSPLGSQPVLPKAPTPTSAPFKILGFLPYWSLTKLQPSYAEALTDLAFFSLTLEPDGTLMRLTKPTEEEPGWTTLSRHTGLAQRFAKTKANGQNLSLVIFQYSEPDIQALLSEPELHAHTLIQEVGPIMQEHGFTDLNIDIESVRDASPSAQASFTQFLATVKQDLVSQKLGTLTVDLQVISLFQPYLTDPIEVGKIADYVLLMGYDFHYPGSLLAGAVAPLGGAGETRVFDVTSSLQAALQQIPKSKILLGIPFYGYEWQTLRSLPGSPAIPETGVLASNTRALELKATCTTCVSGQDPIAREPYLIFPEGVIYHQLYYQDNQAIRDKIKLAQDADIAGVGFWALGYETAANLEPLSQALIGR